MLIHVYTDYYFYCIQYRTNFIATTFFSFFYLFDELMQFLVFLSCIYLSFAALHFLYATLESYLIISLCPTNDAVEGSMYSRKYRKACFFFFFNEIYLIINHAD